MYASLVDIIVGMRKGLYDFRIKNTKKKVKPVFRIQNNKK